MIVLPNDVRVDANVMVMLRLISPPSITVQMLEAPPPGEQPYARRP